MIVDEKALLGRNSIKMVSYCSFWTSDSSSIDFWKGWIPDCCFLEKELIPIPNIPEAGFPSMEKTIPYLFATFVLLLLHSHDLHDNPPEDQNVKLKEENRPMWTQWKFFLVSIMIILVIFTYKFNQHDKYYKYPDQTIGRRHPAALMKTQNKTKTG